MATKYSMDVLDASNGEWTPVALFADIIPVDVLRELCRTMWENVEGASNVVVTDMDTGEIVADAAEEEPDCDWGFNEDMGYDPYMGCYTDDC